MATAGESMVVHAVAMVVVAVTVVMALARRRGGQKVTVVKAEVDFAAVAGTALAAEAALAQATERVEAVLATNRAEVAMAMVKERVEAAMVKERVEAAPATATDRAEVATAMPTETTAGVLCKLKSYRK